jgi:hypothetical protein
VDQRPEPAADGETNGVQAQHHGAADYRNEEKQDPPAGAVDVVQTAHQDGETGQKQHTGGVTSIPSATRGR